MRSEGYGTWVDLCVSVSVSVTSISLLGCLFVSQRIPPTERAMKVRNFERFSLKTLRCKARAGKSQYANTQLLTTA